MHFLVDHFLIPWNIFQYVKQDTTRTPNGNTCGISNNRFKQVNHFNLYHLGVE